MNSSADKNIRSLIKEYLKDAPTITAAGFILFKVEGKNFKMLGLKRDGKFDLPKGHLDNDETSLDCAFREAFEEASISKISFPFGLKTTHVNTLQLYLGTTDETGAIARNPVTGLFEHESLAWVSLEEMEKSCFSYLKPAIRWASNIIRTYNR